MALELKFSKSNKETQWGFRIVGGADFDQPLVVVKVAENSIAEQVGLEVGDIIVRINDTPTTGLTHAEVHDILVSVGLEFVIAVRRGVFTENIRSDEDFNYDFENIIEEINKSVEQDIIQEAVDRIEGISTEAYPDTNDIINLSENLAGQEEMVYTKETQTRKTFTDTLAHSIKTDKKWSTFLMKPDKPVPKPHKVKEQEKALEDGYKVVISKQPVRRAFMQPEKKVQFDQNVVELEAETQYEDDEYLDENRNIEEPEENVIQDEEETHEDNDNIENDSIEEPQDVADGIENDESSNLNDFNDYLEEERESTEIHYKPLSEIIVDETAMTLEEQLRTVQKQLQALSQLPSAVQLTLDAISAQLASIVSTNEENQEENEETNEANMINEDKPTEENCEESWISEKAEAEYHQEDSNSSIGEELEEDVITEEIREIMERTVQEAEAEREEKLRIEEELKAREEEEMRAREEEELRARMEEEERLAKEQKGRQTPMQRPIILPGGRRWSNPDDAVPSVRKPQMSDEKMIETIDSNLEVIAGKRKGINFMKYQPPPKNLDYLQRSDVYRLVHDMEPPVKGITSRPEMVAAVQDYYKASQDAP